MVEMNQRDQPGKGGNEEIGGTGQASREEGEKDAERPKEEV